MSITSADYYKFTRDVMKEISPEFISAVRLRAKQLMIEIAEKTIDLYMVSDGTVIMFNVPSSCVSDKACQEFRKEYENAGWSVHFDEAYGNITIILSTNKLEG